MRTESPKPSPSQNKIYENRRSEKTEENDKNTEVQKNRYENSCSGQKRGKQVLRKKAETNYIRTDAPKNNRKYYVRTNDSAKENPEKNLYENRCSENHTEKTI